jgi:hypothetical protein
MKLYVFLWERHLAAMIWLEATPTRAALLPIKRCSAPYPADKAIQNAGSSSPISASEASFFLPT